MLLKKNKTTMKKNESQKIQGARMKKRKTKDKKYLKLKRINKFH
jgi:hypothetical protein